MSVLAHALVIALLLGPLLAPRLSIATKTPGSTGAAGGGGGGHIGASNAKSGPERIHYVRLAPAAQAVATPVPPVNRVKPPTPIVKPPPLEKPRVVQPQVTPPASMTTQTEAPSVVAIATNAGAGTDGTNGAGPGTGGGTGTGVGTGRGSASGPGTGGTAEGTIYPATPDFAVIPPLPVPKQLQGKTVELRFTVDANGRVVSFDFDPTGDSDYDRQLRERLGEYHFRPAHRADGTAVPSVFVTQFVL